MRTNLLKFSFLIVILTAATASFAQSTDQLFPTPVRTSEIVSSIKARTIGDGRLTTYYYTFEGEQGDVFINVQSKNFTGDIDLFVIPGQVPMTKMVIYGDQPETETGRVVYLRKPERLLLRIQGRSPGDGDASVRIKFAGSFAVSKLDDSGAPPIPTVERETESGIRVNSVGTILEVVPKLKPTPEAVASQAEPQEERPDAQLEQPKEPVKEDVTAAKEPEPKSPLEVVVSDPIAADVKPKEAAPRRRTAGQNRRVRKTPEPKSDETSPTAKREEPKAADSTSRRKRPPAEKPAEKKPESAPVDPMANLRLVVYFKNGSTIDRPMTEVLRFSVERAVLTVISKNGTIGRYKMIEVSRVSIE